MTRTAISKSKPLKRGFSPKDPELGQRLKKLMAPNTWVSMRAYGADWLVMVSAASVSWEAFTRFGVSFASAGLYVLCVAVIASRQKGLENLVHEASHYHLSPHRKLNDAMCYALGAMWLHPGLTLVGERRVHVSGHHAHFWDRARDPKRAHGRSLGLEELPQPTAGGAIVVLAVAFMRFYRWKLFAVVTGATVRSMGASRVQVLRGLALAGVVSALVYAGLLLPLVLYWLVPALTLLPLVSFLAQTSEHAGARGASEFEMTRNKLGLVQRCFFHPHADGYHIVHHLYPGIPHQNLPRAHRLLMRDPRYRNANHCFGFGIVPGTRRGLLSDLVVQ